MAIWCTDIGLCCIIFLLPLPHEACCMIIPVTSACWAHFLSKITLIRPLVTCNWAGNLLLFGGVRKRTSNTHTTLDHVIFVFFSNHHGLSQSISPKKLIHSAADNAWHVLKWMHQAPLNWSPLDCNVSSWSFKNFFCFESFGYPQCTKCQSLTHTPRNMYHCPRFIYRCLWLCLFVRKTRFLPGLRLVRQNVSRGKDLANLRKK